MSYRVLAFDLDGTLLDPDKHILQESLDAIREARRAGVQVLIVTGRHLFIRFIRHCSWIHRLSAVTVPICTIIRGKKCFPPIR
mgnify:CR=1 FL=1